MSEINKFNHFKRDNKKNSDLIFGIRPLEEAIKNNLTIDKVWVAEGELSEQIGSILRGLRSLGVIWKQVPEMKLNSLVNGNHQGIVASISPVAFFDLQELITGSFEKGEEPLFVVLDGVTDVRNMGAIARSALCAGAHGIVIPQKGSVGIGSDAVKTSAGALLKLPVCKVPSIYHALKVFQANGIKLAGASEKSKDLIYNCDFKGPMALVMGDEEIGLSADAWKLCDTLFQIPLHTSGVGSLNVSVAAGISLFEIVRQRG